nr:MAG: ECF sigma factor [Bacteriophage sp.]
MNAKEKELVEKNMGLVIFIAQKYFNAGIEADDAISAGSLGLIKAANSFNLAKKIKFSTYASRCIENEILMCVRSAKRRQREVSLYEPVSVDGDGGELLVMDILETGEDISKHAEDEAEIIILRNAIKKLSAKDQTIIKLLFGLENTEKKSQEEVASYFKVTQSLISRRKARSLRRLRTEMERYM